MAILASTPSGQEEPEHRGDDREHAVYRATVERELESRRGLGDRLIDGNRVAQFHGESEKAGIVATRDTVSEQLRPVLKAPPCTPAFDSEGRPNPERPAEHDPHRALHHPRRPRRSDLAERRVDLLTGCGERER